jgi:MFS transporter, DHA1 family, tetracycline resistance protein
VPHYSISNIFLLKTTKYLNACLCYNKFMINTDALKKKQVFVLFFILFTDMIGFGMSIPLLGILFTDVKNPFYMGNLLNPLNLVLYFGIFMSLYSFGQFIANPILGSLSDNIGRKKVLSFAIFGTFVSRVFFLIGLLNLNIFLIFSSRFVDGVTGGIISLSNASITDTTNPEERAKYIGITMSGFSLGGFVVGPVLFILFSYFDIYYATLLPFILATFLSFVAFLLSVFFFPETLNKDKIQKVPNFNFLWLQLLNSITNLKTIFKNKKIQPFFIAVLVYYLGFSSYTTFSSAYLVAHYSLNNTQIGFYFLLVGVVMTIMQAFVAYRIMQKNKMRDFIVYLLTALLFSMFLFAFAFSHIVLFVNACFFSVLVSLSMVSIQTEVARFRTENKGALLGAFSSVQVLAMVIAPVIAGLISKISIKLPFLMAGVLLFISGFLLKNGASKEE